MKKNKVTRLLAMGLSLAMMLSVPVCASEDSANTLTIMHLWTDENLEQNDANAVCVQKAIDVFKAQHPEVEVVEEKVSQSAGYETKLKTLAAANELPDIFLALASSAQTFDDNGQIEDLAPYLAADTEWSDRLIEGSYSDMQRGDKVLGMTRFMTSNHVMYYNEEIFKACGIEKFPENTDEFMDAVITLRENGYIPMACGNKNKYMISSQIMPGLLCRFTDVDWYNNLRSFDASFEDPDALAAIEYMEELIDIGFFNEDVNSLEETQARQQYFYTGKAAMYCEGSWMISYIYNEMPEELRDKVHTCFFPAVTGKEELANQAIAGQGWSFCLNSDLSEEKKAVALDFLKSLSAPEVQRAGVERGLLPVVNEVDYDASKLDPMMSEFMELYNGYDVKYGCPETQLSTVYMDMSYSGYQELSVGTLNAAELAALLQEAHESSK